MAEGDRRLPPSNPESQPFDASDVPADYVTLSQPRLLAAAHNLRGGLYGFQNRWSLARHQRALAQRYGQEMADDEVNDEWEP
ncbi:MAG TPA: hypothetical protein VNM16_03745 [Bacillota bacterium]|nr:hypothetical protein [Bacillota bacterium]